MKIKEGIEMAYVTVKDTLFPVFCLGCDKEGDWVCNTCLEAVAVDGFFACPLCHQSTEDGLVCRWCRPISSVTQIVALESYGAHTILGQLIHAVKYAFAQDCMEAIHELLSLFLEEYHQLILSYDVLVPVPLHPRRFAERGFNQSAYIATYLSDELNIPVAHPLRRTRYTLPQAKQNRARRWQQMKDAFTCFDIRAVRGKRVLLIDDVYTTGATMFYCAETLCAAGARTVSGFVLARGG